MKKIKYIEKEPLLAYLEHMGVSEYIINAISDENKFPVMTMMKLNADDYYPKKGDDIYYVDDELGEIEHGIVHSIHFKNGEIDTIAVDFGNDFDEFYGSAFFDSLFPNEELARGKLEGRI